MPVQVRMPIFNSPPGWPSPPAGWTPPDDWKPDPGWPPAPDGWQWWIDETPAAPTPAPVPPHPPVTAQTASPSGVFGKKKQLEAENAELRHWIAYLEGLEPMQQAALVDNLRAEVGALQQQIASVNAQLARAQATIVQTEEIALLQEAGIYDYQHPLADAVAYKTRLDQLRTQIKAMTKDDGAVLAATNWQVNGSAVEGRKMVRDFSKLMLRAYNAEADSCVQSVRPHRLQPTIDRLGKVRDTIAKLGRTMSIRISDGYHHARLDEIRLTADYRAKQEAEKEESRAERERLREEAAAQREFEREKARLLKEQAHYKAAVAKLRSNGEDATELEAKLAELGVELSSVEAREANIRAGYVYVISNLGAFGADVVKIGMTRRLEPDDRIRELGDASVPFKFDTHALIFSDDAVGLETQLHNALEAKRVNQVNRRREFFRATPAGVRVLLEDIAGQHLLEYHETAEALEWRASRQQADL